ncbi:MAG: FMN-binding protein [Chitinispirillales bacterium]|jgi:electron transport complex protein RnfG|nr:FMN-binding protein [Chitinispirillales bacterium]
MGDIIKLTLTLTIISAIAGLAIGVVNDKTKDKIAAQQEQARLEALETVFPEGVRIVEMKNLGAGVVPDLYWIAFDDSADTVLAGYAFEVSGIGYAGDIKFMVGVGIDGNILGLTVLDHNETPGLGSRVNEIASAKYIWYPVGGDDGAKPWFKEQFVGLSSLKPIIIDRNLAEWHKLDERTQANLRNNNAVTIITGSTITTEAFTRAIGQHIAGYLEELGGYCCPATRKEIEAKKAVEAVAVETNDNEDNDTALLLD